MTDECCSGKGRELEKLEVQADQRRVLQTVLVINAPAAEQDVLMPLGEPLGGVDGLNSRIVEPRQLRVGFKKSF